MRKNKYTLTRKEPYSFSIVTEDKLFDLAFTLIDESKIHKTYPHCKPPLDHASASVADLHEALRLNGYEFRLKTW